MAKNNTQNKLLKYPVKLFTFFTLSVNLDSGLNWSLFYETT